MFFNEDHLRITTVRTIDGTTPIFTEQGKAQTKIVIFPDNKDSKRLLDELNGRLPNHLKMKIEKVKGYTPQQLHSAPSVNVSDLEKEIQELKALNAQLIKNQEAAKEGQKESENGESKETEQVKQPKQTKEKVN